MRPLLITKGHKGVPRTQHEEEDPVRSFFILEKIQRRSFFMIQKIQMAFLQA